MALGMAITVAGIFDHMYPVTETVAKAWGTVTAKAMAVEMDGATARAAEAVEAAGADIPTTW
jgi:hypothetical protein